MPSEKMEKWLTTELADKKSYPDFLTCEKAAALIRALLAYWQSPSAEASAEVARLLAEIEK